MKTALVFMTTLLLVFGISACNDRDDSAKGSSGMSAGMKCGAGKCGANMFDGNAALAKKKANIIKQMQANDPRRDCVANAETSKAVYNCVRDPETGKLSKSFSGEPSTEGSMKCGGGKCGAGKCGSM